MNRFYEQTNIPGLMIINRATFSDDRGFFREIFHIDELCQELGITFEPKQLNHSLSYPGVIRGLHAENWNKLVYPITGRTFVAIVDLRPETETFGKVETFVFDEKTPKAMFIPKGLANSICAIGDNPTHYLYLVDSYYDGSDTRAIAWNDPDLNIKWPIKKPIISDRDKRNPSFRQLFPNKN